MVLQNFNYDLATITVASVSQWLYNNSERNNFQGKR